MVKLYTKLTVYRYIKSNFIIRIRDHMYVQEQWEYSVDIIIILLHSWSSRAASSLPGGWCTCCAQARGWRRHPAWVMIHTAKLHFSSWFLLSAHYCLPLTFPYCDVFEGYLLPELCNYTRCHPSPVKMCFHCELLEIISALCRYNGYLLHIDNMTKCSL